MEDDAAAGDLTNSLLFQLSRAKEDQVDLLGCFHKVILVSAPEDQYVPSYSASIEVCGERGRKSAMQSTM